jgi:hypothetical protein
MGIVLSDNTMYAQTDTYGAYIYNAGIPNPGNAGGTGSWEQQVSTSRFPNADPTLTVDYRQTWVGALGAYAFAAAPSNTNIAYMVWAGYVYKTINRGGTWTNTNASFTPLARPTSVSNGEANPNTTGSTNGDATYGPKIAIDPINPNVVYVGFQLAAGAYATFDGGATWTKLTGLPNPSVDTMSYAFSLDSRVSTQSGGVSTILYAFANGVGCYRSANAGNGSLTFTKITGSGTGTTGLTSFRRTFCDSSGKLWVTDNGGTKTNVWSRDPSSGTWTHHTTDLSGVNTQGTYHAIAEDALVASAQRIVLLDDLAIVTQSTDGGSTWNGSNNTTTGVGKFSVTDIPYLGTVTSSPPLTTLNSGFTIGNAAFDNSGNLYWASGVGVFKVTLPNPLTSSQFTWTSVSSGIEQLVTNLLIASPTGDRVAASWDRALIPINSGHYAVKVAPADFVMAPGGCGLDWASTNPATFAAVTAFGGCQVSSDGGQTWTAKTGISSSSTCCIAASTATNFVAVGSSANVQITSNGGTSWTDKGSYFNSNFGIALNSMVVGSATGACDQIICADRVNSGQFTLLYTASAASGGGFYQTTDGGSTWAKKSAIDAVNGVPATILVIGQRMILRSVYGKANHLIFSAATTNSGAPTHPYTAATNCFISTDGGATWADLSSNIRDVWGFDAGPQVGTYPRIYVWGWKNVSGTWTPGVWYSDDQGSTWTKAAVQEMWGTLDIVNWLEADKVNASRFYVTYEGSGCSYYSA